jgi:hypothetical protein
MVAQSAATVDARMIPDLARTTGRPLPPLDKGGQPLRRRGNGLIGPEAVSPLGKQGMISHDKAHTPAPSYAAPR